MHLKLNKHLKIEQKLDFAGHMVSIVCFVCEQNLLPTKMGSDGAKTCEAMCVVVCTGIHLLCGRSSER